jgi:hypothetical protein
MQEAQKKEAYEFIFNNIDSVPHLEALLLVWTSRPKSWTAEEVSRRLYINRESAEVLLRALSVQGFLAAAADPVETFQYQPTSEEQDRTLELVHKAYRRETVAVSTMIHSKGSRAVRDFARAFRFTKDKEKEKD